MITGYKDIYEFLESDKPKLDYQREKCLPQIRKEFMRDNIFPNYKYVSYSPSSGNEYLIVYYAANLYQVDNPFVRYCALLWRDDDRKYRYVITWLKGEYRHTPKQCFKITPIIYAITDHFFEQYQNRFLKDNNLTSDEVVCRFLMRNPVYTPIEINEKVNRNIKKKASNYDRGFSVNDGMCFTRYFMDVEDNDDDIDGNENIKALAFVFTTYYNPQDMPEEQKDAIEIEEDKSWELYCKKLLGNI